VSFYFIVWYESTYRVIAHGCAFCNKQQTEQSHCEATMSRDYVYCIVNLSLYDSNDVGSSGLCTECDFATYRDKVKVKEKS
jgi:hypothetical protein